MEKTSKKTKKYSLGRFWTRDMYKGYESCSCGQASSKKTHQKVENFDSLCEKNVASGLTKREHCLVLGYFEFFKSKGMLERVGS